MNSVAVSYTGLALAPAERRRTPRESAELALLVRCHGREVPGRLINIAAGGAQVETREPIAMIPISPLFLSCGLVQVHASIVWARGNRLGLRFPENIPQDWLRHLVDRAKLVELHRIVRSA